MSVDANILAHGQLPGTAGGSGTLVALLDAANLPGLHQRIETSGVPALCLFKGETAHSLRDVAPYLIRLSGDQPHLNALLATGPNPDAPPGLLHGILLQTEIDLHGLRRHFRRFMRVQAEDHIYFFRFWDPPAAAAYFDAIADSADRDRWFAPREGGRIEAIFVPDHAGTGLRAYRPGPIPAQPAWHFRPFRLTKAELIALRATRAQEGLDQLVTLMGTTFSELSARIGQGIFDSIIRRAILRCAGFGIRERAHVFRFVAWDLHAQGNFEDVDPGAELARILATDLAEAEKMQRLVARIATLSPANLQTRFDHPEQRR